MATYGDGEVDAFLTFLVPEWAESAVPSGAMAEETAEARRMWREKPPVGYGSPAIPPVIAWGVNARGDLLCWVTSERDSGRRPVAVDTNKAVLGWAPGEEAVIYGRQSNKKLHIRRFGHDDSQ